MVGNRFSDMDEDEIRMEMGWTESSMLVLFHRFMAEGKLQEKFEERLAEWAQEEESG